MNRFRCARALAIFLVLMLTAGCGSIAPKEKTVILSEKTSAPQATGDAQSTLRFEVKKITSLPMDKINPSGIHPDVSKAIIGWIDEDNLAAMSVQYNILETAPVTEEGVEQPTQRVLTQFARINYQYGFYDPILTLTDVEAECFDLSADGSMVAFVAGNTLDVYSLHNGSRLQSLNRDVLASQVTFAQQGNKLYFTAAGENRRLECMDVSTGEVTTVLSGQSYRVLAADEQTMVFSLLFDGKQQVGYSSGGSIQEGLLTGGTATSCCILPSGDGLIAYGGDLYLINAGGKRLVQQGVLAFDLAPDDMHMAFALRNEDGSVDVRVGYWGGSKIINDKLVYKDLGLEVNAMYFSPDLYKLYLQGIGEASGLTAYTFEFQ